MASEHAETFQAQLLKSMKFLRTVKPSRGHERDEKDNLNLFVLLMKRLLCSS